MEADILPPLMHIANQIPVFPGQQVIRIIRPLKKESRSKIHTGLHLRQGIRPFHTIFHIMPHNYKLIPMQSTPIIRLQPRSLNNPYYFPIIIIRKHPTLSFLSSKPINTYPPNTHPLPIPPQSPQYNPSTA